ncbi:MAG: hypothetical protein GF401_15195 [Chitinivibrionales bacterium]|nr:hypothetical protein [Chitinivibrionales bacterium]
MKSKIICYADKCMLKIEGLSVKGLRPVELEKSLSQKLNTVVRVIGVTGDRLDMDIYGMKESDIERNSEGIVVAVAAAEGITIADVKKITLNDGCINININEVAPVNVPGCAGQRWRSCDTKSRDHSDR